MCCQTNTYSLVYIDSAIYYTQMMSTHTYMYKLYINTGIRNTDRQIRMYMYVLRITGQSYGIHVL